MGPEFRRAWLPEGISTWSDLLVRNIENFEQVLVKGSLKHEQTILVLAESIK